MSWWVTGTLTGYALRRLSDWLDHDEDRGGVTNS